MPNMCSKSPPETAMLCNLPSPLQRRHCCSPTFSSQKHGNQLRRLLAHMSSSYSTPQMDLQCLHLQPSRHLSTNCSSSALLSLLAGGPCHLLSSWQLDQLLKSGGIYLCLNPSLLSFHSSSPAFLPGLTPLSHLLFFSHTELLSVSRTHFLSHFRALALFVSCFMHIVVPLPHPSNLSLNITSSKNLCLTRFQLRSPPNVLLFCLILM